MHKKSVIAAKEVTMLVKIFLLYIVSVSELGCWKLFTWECKEPQQVLWRTESIKSLG